jgi:hypothetical protein
MKLTNGICRCACPAASTSFTIFCASLCSHAASDAGPPATGSARRGTGRRRRSPGRPRAGHRRQPAVQVDERCWRLSSPPGEARLDQRAEQLGSRTFGLGRRRRRSKRAPGPTRPSLPQPASALAPAFIGAKNARRPARSSSRTASRTACSSANSPGSGASGVVRARGQVAAEDRASMLSCPTMWKCSSSSRFFPTKSCGSRSACSSGMRQASSCPRAGATAAP